LLEGKDAQLSLVLNNKFINFMDILRDNVLEARYFSFKVEHYNLCKTSKDLLGIGGIDSMFAGMSLALQDMFKYSNELKNKLANVGSRKSALNL